MAAVELSVFGLASKVDITTLTLALTGTVGFIVVFEMGAHRLEHHLAGTPYMGMLAKIYKGAWWMRDRIFHSCSTSFYQLRRVCTALQKNKGIVVRSVISLSYCVPSDGRQYAS